jgi:hypothetical protein
VQVNNNGDFGVASAACGTGGTGSPGPPNTSIQFNCSGVFCGDSRLEYAAPNLELTQATLQFYSAPSTLAMQLKAGSSGTGILDVVNSSNATISEWNASTTVPNFGMLGTINIQPGSGQIVPSLQITEAGGGTQDVIYALLPSGAIGVELAASGNVTMSGLSGTGNRIVCAGPSGLLLSNPGGGCTGAGVPGTPNTSIQFNCSGTFCGDARLEYAAPNVELNDAVLQFYSSGALDMQVKGASTNILQVVNSSNTVISQWNSNTAVPSFGVLGTMAVQPSSSASPIVPLLQISGGSLSSTADLIYALQPGGAIGMELKSDGTTTLGNLAGSGNRIVCAGPSGLLLANPGGTPCTGVGVPGNPTTSIQFNCSGLFCGDAKLEYASPNLLLNDAVLQFYSSGSLDMQLKGASTNILQVVNSSNTVISQWNSNTAVPSFSVAGTVAVQPVSSASPIVPMLQINGGALSSTADRIYALQAGGAIALELKSDGSTVLGNLAGTGNRIVCADPSGLLLSNPGGCAGASGVCGADTQIIYNNAGACGADAGLTWSHTSPGIFLANGLIVATGSNGGFGANPRSGSGDQWLFYNPSGTEMRLYDSVSGDHFYFESNGNFDIDPQGLNNGPLTPGIVFGTGATGEGIASKRTSGGNQFGLDFYTSSNSRLSIANNGGAQFLGPTVEMHSTVLIDPAFLPSVSILRATAPSGNTQDLIDLEAFPATKIFEVTSNGSMNVGSMTWNQPLQSLNISGNTSNPTLVLTGGSGTNALQVLNTLGGNGLSVGSGQLSMALGGTVTTRITNSGVIGGRVQTSDASGNPLFDSAQIPTPFQVIDGGGVMHSANQFVATGASTPLVVNAAGIGSDYVAVNNLSSGVSYLRITNTGTFLLGAYTGTGNSALCVTGAGQVYRSGFTSC